MHGPTPGDTVTVYFAPWQSADCYKCGAEFTAARTRPATYKTHADVLCGQCQIYGSAGTEVLTATEQDAAHAIEKAYEEVTSIAWSASPAAVACRALLLVARELDLPQTLRAKLTRDAAS